MGPKALIVVATLALAGCQGVGLTSSFCDPRAGIAPLRYTPGIRAAIKGLPGAAELERDSLAINNYGATNCGWKP